jgi:tetratricopeptide (TPR) repeat protein
VGPVHVEGLGTLTFPVTGTPEARADFHRGVLLLHSFEYEDAAQAFRAAQETDPDMVMAYWGEAMTYNHPVWMEQDPAAARRVLTRLGPTPEEREAHAPTDRERMYVAAVDALYEGTGAKDDRDLAYLEAMERLHQAYPDDDEATLFHALALLGSAHQGRDFDIYGRAAAEVEPVFERNPDHPGAAHYLIHAWDDPLHARRALPAARAYSGIAPRAAHAQHMTSHIFVALGMWSDVVTANVRARRVQDSARAEQGLPPNACGHYGSWLHYGYLMQGRLDDARDALSACAALAETDPSARPGYVMMRARQVVDGADVDADRVSADPAPAWADEGKVGPVWAWTDAWVAVRRGDVAAGHAFVDNWSGRLPADDRTSAWPRLMVSEMRALVASAEGRGADAIGLLRAAADSEAALPFEFGPPPLPKPAHELLGEVLLQEGQVDAAAEVFRAALERTPGRPAAERGLAATAR